MESLGAMCISEKISLKPRCLNSRVKDLFDLTRQNDPGHHWILAPSIPRSAATWRPQLAELLEWYSLEMPVVPLGTMSLSLDSLSKRSCRHGARHGARRI